MPNPVPSVGDGAELVVAYRPIRSYSGKEYGSASSSRIASRRLYEFNPFPLFLIIKMRDKAAVNGITVKETIGDTTKTITPPLYFFHIYLGWLKIFHQSYQMINISEF